MVDGYPRDAVRWSRVELELQQCQRRLGQGRYGGVRMLRRVEKTVDVSQRGRGRVAGEATVELGKVGREGWGGGEPESRDRARLRKSQGNIRGCRVRDNYAGGRILDPTSFQGSDKRSRV